MSKRLSSLGFATKFILLSVVPLVALGLVLAKLLAAQVEQLAMQDATEAAELTARLGIQPLLTPNDLKNGISFEHLEALDAAIRAGKSGDLVVRFKIWNRRDEVVFSDQRNLIGKRFERDGDRAAALAGETVADVERLDQAEHVNEHGYEELLEVYVPIRFTERGRPAGMFEMYLPYAPIAAAVERAKQTIYGAVAVGLALLYLLLLRIVIGASRTLRRQAAENQHQALHDSLTGLPNRTLLFDRLERAIAAARREDGAGALLTLDLDRFKDVNDALGHRCGDRLLCQISERLGEALREIDTVARLGADQFAVLLPSTRDATTAAQVAEKLLSALEAPFELDGVGVSVDASIGIALFPDDGRGAEELVHHADVAMYAAKERHNGFEHYEASEDGKSPERLALLGELRRALDRHELVLHYQPKASLRTGEIEGVEALLRWEHPTRGIVSPVEFLPLAERTGLIRPLTAYVLDVALGQARAWRDGGLELTVAVNLAMANLLDPRLPDQVAELLERWGLPGEALELEVTESSFMADVGRAVDNLTRLSDLGVHIAIDDFGTGYSSLAYLQQLPIDEIKIDRSFILNMDAAESAGVIVSSTIELGHNLGLRVIAEGVETAEHWQRLSEWDCDVVQGYLLSRPLPAPELERWLAERRPALDAARIS